MSKLFACLLLILLLVTGCSSNIGRESQTKTVGQNLKTATVELAAGTPYATMAYIYQSNNPGPAVMVVGGIHGNEPAGAMAAQKFCDPPLRKGTLIVIPKANIVALENDIRTLPEIGDLNRAYPGKKEGTPADRITYNIVELMKKYKVNMVLDLHEGYAFNAVDQKSVGETILPGTDDTSVMLAMDAVEFINRQITDTKKKFSVLANPIAGSTAHYANTVLGVPSFTVETSSAQPLEDRVNYSFQIARFLVESQGILDK